MKTWRKEASLLLVGMMIMSGLVALSAPVIADENVTISAGTGTTYNIAFNDNNMISHPGVVGADEQIQINEAGAGAGNLIYLGEDELALQFVITASQDPLVDVQFLIQGTGTVSVGDDTGETITIAQWATPQLTWTITFTIDSAASGVVESLYPLTCRVIEDPAGAADAGSIGIQIYVSSVLHNDASDTTIDTVHELVMDPATGQGDYIKDSGDDFPFEAGDEFKEAFFDLNNNAYFTIADTQINLTAPTGFTLVRNYAKFVGDITAGNDEDLIWRLNVAAGTAPGVYQGTAVLTYIRATTGADVTITENSRPIDYTVDYNFADDDPMNDGDLYSQYQCYATNVTVLNYTRQVDYLAPYDIPVIEQSDYTDKTLELQVTIVNNGNSDLYNVEFELDPTGWPYFRNPLFFWESAGTLDYDTISDTIDIAEGASVTFTITVFVDAAIPIGEHRLPILYNGYYFNDGALGGSTGFMETNGGNDLEILFSIWVEDPVIQCHISDIDTTVTDEIGDKGDIRAETVTVTIQNDEEYNFIDVIVRANFTGTPWYMPVINMADPWVDAENANAAMPLATWDAGAEEDIDFTVDTDPSYVPDRYPFQLEITAVIEETLDIVTVVVDYTQGAVIDFAGYGPDIYIQAFTADDIVPGEQFVLDMTIENVGDDTLRDITIMIDTDGTYEYDWALESSFKQQFDWSGVFADWGSQTGGQVTWNGEFPEDMFYTLEDLDVDNVREIVEINLYMDGVYSQPAARISVIHILDLAPGATTNVAFDMITDKDMVNGKPYDFPVNITGIDTDGVPYYAERWITVQTSLPGDSYNPVELNWFDAGLKALALFLFFIIVLAILLFVYNMFKGEPYDEDEEDFDFEDEEPFEPETEKPAADTPEKKEELVEP